mmetsp:Transcript_76800/g.207001  ORF Transcript_76800/g.207001 Transcript_76800/m.207001 type:complete len:213 (-) Transcript_76800:61-699(-)
MPPARLRGRATVLVELSGGAALLAHGGSVASIAEGRNRLERRRGGLADGDGRVMLKQVAHAADANIPTMRAASDRTAALRAVPDIAFRSLAANAGKPNRTHSTTMVAGRAICETQTTADHCGTLLRKSPTANRTPLAVVLRLQAARCFVTVDQTCPVVRASRAEITRGGPNAIPSLKALKTCASTGSTGGWGRALAPTTASRPSVRHKRISA